MSNEQYTNAYTALSKVAVETLSHDERERLWRGVADAHAQLPVPSPYMSFSAWFFHARVLVPALALMVLVVGGGTTALADAARPGDTLFGVKRAAESVRLALTPETKKDAVRVAIAQERVEEIESLIAEETQRRSARTASRAKEAPVPTEVTADVAFSAMLSREMQSDDETDTIDKSSSDEAPEEATVVSLLSVASDSPAMDDTTETEDATATEDTESAEEMRTTHWSKRDRDIRASLKTLGTVSEALRARGNYEGHEQVRKAVAHLSEKLNELPFEEQDTFRALIADELLHVDVVEEKKDVDTTHEDERADDADNTDDTVDTATTTPADDDTATGTATTTEPATTSTDILQSSGEVRIQEELENVVDIPVVSPKRGGLFRR